MTFDTVYTASESLTSLACSDGKNGLMTRWEYTDLSEMYPYVAAFSGVEGWNSENCGNCYQIIDVSTLNSIYVTAIDHAGKDYEFNLAEEAFTEVFGVEGDHDGHGTAVWAQADANKCKGNKGKTPGPAPHYKDWL